MKTMKLTR